MSRSSETPERVFIPDLGTPTQAPADYLATLYPSVVSDTRLDAYLNTTRLRKEGRWKDMPVSDSSPQNIKDSLAKIARFILRTFVKPRGKRITRAVVRDHDLTICVEKEGADEDEDRVLETMPAPSLVVRAAGPSFEYLPNAKSTSSSAVGWENVASMFVTRPAKELQDVEALIREVTPYARRLFYSQPNRIFIRSLIVSETQAILVHFDRSGCEYSHPLNIHDDPKTFIRLLVGLSSTDEQLLGFDTSVQWTIKKNMKASGTITVSGQSGEKRVYDLKLTRPIFKRDGIRGRGTTCWFAVDPDTKQDVVIKDSWRLDNRRPEYEILKRANGLDGVCQMLDYECVRCQTGDFRSSCDPDTLTIRILERIVMQAYGESVEHFKTPLEALAAIRDAVEGHRRLVERNILHCDVSSNNILLGLRKAVGRRGVLTDLDMAVDTKQDVRVEWTGVRVATRLFQSISALNSFDTPRTPAHDYLDDLESFFYVLCFLLLVFYGHGGKKPLDDPAYATVRSWSEGMERISSDAKFSFIVRDVIFIDTFVAKIDAAWGEPAKELVYGFRKFMKDIVLAKDRLSDPALPPPTTPDGTPIHCFSSLHTDMETHYATVIKLFDEAIAKYQSASLHSAHPPNVKAVAPVTDDAVALHVAASNDEEPPRDAVDVLYVQRPSDDTRPPGPAIGARPRRTRKRVDEGDGDALAQRKRRRRAP